MLELIFITSENRYILYDYVNDIRTPRKHPVAEQLQVILAHEPSVFAHITNFNRMVRNYKKNLSYGTWRTLET